MLTELPPIFQHSHKFYYKLMYTFKHKCITMASELQLTFVTTDTNECQSSPCQNGGTCIDQVNAYQCTCKDDWKGTNCDTGKSALIYQYSFSLFKHRLRISIRPVSRRTWGQSPLTFQNVALCPLDKFHSEYYLFIFIYLHLS